MTIRGLAKKFQGTTIYDDFSIDLPMGKFISIFGPERMREEYIHQYDFRPDADGCGRGAL